ncbi:MAG: sphinganine-phosphate aldolase, partial [Acidimicrobiaceae bacterium]
CEQTTRAVRARERLVSGVRAIDGLAIVGEPEATMAAITSDGVDVFAVHDELDRRGWHLDRQGPPDSLHATCMPVHDDVIDEFLADLRAAVDTVGAARSDDRSTSYAKME